LPFAIPPQPMMPTLNFLPIKYPPLTESLIFYSKREASLKESKAKTGQQSREP